MVRIVFCPAVTNRYKLTVANMTHSWFSFSSCHDNSCFLVDELTLDNPECILKFSAYHGFAILNIMLPITCVVTDSGRDRWNGGRCRNHIFKQLVCCCDGHYVNQTAACNCNGSALHDVSGLYYDSVDLIENSLSQPFASSRWPNSHHIVSLGTDSIIK